jgi:formate dehydrogenase subunit gamma
MVTLLNTVEDPIARKICSDHGDKPDELLEILHAVQNEKGFLSDGALRTITHALNLSRAEVHGVVSFYHDYKREKQADQTIKICRAEACQALGADALIADAEKAFGVKLDKGGIDVGLEAAYCLGNCALSPAVMIDNKLYGRVDIAKLKNLSMKHREGSKA